MSQTMRETAKILREAMLDSIRYKMKEQLQLDDYADETDRLIEDTREAMSYDGTDHETIDGCVPIYYSDITSCLASQPSISGLAKHAHGIEAEDTMTRIQQDIYCALEEHWWESAEEWLESVAEELGVIA
tara:strand:- start:41 stop:430 length:390 start_codon:yes stop_codon:yes gene_type:complete